MLLANPCVGLLLALAAGIAWQESWGQALLPAWGWGLGQGLAVFGVLLGWRWRRGTVLAALILTFCCGGWLARRQRLPAMPAVCNVDGGAWQVLVDAPPRRQRQGAQVLYHTYAQLLYEQCGAWWMPRQGRVALHLQPVAANERLLQGDVLQVVLRLSPTPARHNLGEPDARWQARRLQLVAQAQVQSGHALLRASSQNGWGRLDALRQQLAQELETWLSPAEAAVAKALSLGDTADLTPAQRDAWGAAGMGHLLAVSGLHVGIVGLCLWRGSQWLLQLLLWGWPALAQRASPRRWAAWVAIPGIVGFCLLSGAPASAQRATCMAVLTMLGLLAHWPCAVGNAWGVAGWLSLLHDPFALYDAGWLLSFVAVAALIWLVPARVEQVPEAPDSGLAPRQAARQRGLPSLQWLKTGLASVQHSLLLSTTVSLVTLPLCAHFFARLAWLAPLVNLLAVPLGALLATPLSLLLCASSVLQQHAGLDARAWCAWPTAKVLQALNALAAWIDRWPWANLTLPAFNGAQLLAYGLFLAALYSGQRRWQMLAGGSGLLGFGLLLGWPAMRAPLPLLVPALVDTPPASLLPTLPTLPALHIYHAYVGQGDATLIRLPHGRHMLIDGGGALLPQAADPARRWLLPLLRQLGVRRLEVLVLTHPHPDHLGGLLEVSRQLPVTRLWHSGIGKQLPALQQLQRQVRQRGGSLQSIATLPATLQLDGVRIDLLHPRPADGSAFYPSLSLNDNSVVLRLHYGVHHMLLAGDIESASEALLLPKLVGTPIDLLKVPHHGSRTSSSAAFLQILQPAAAVISCGVENRFGHPHAVTLARYAAAHVPLWRTDTAGMVHFSSDGRTAQLHSMRPSPLFSARLDP